MPSSFSKKSTNSFSSKVKSAFLFETVIKETPDFV